LPLERVMINIDHYGNTSFCHDSFGIVGQRGQAEEEATLLS
jgi:hypothetical protein